MPCLPAVLSPTTKVPMAESPTSTTGRVSMRAAAAISVLLACAAIVVGCGSSQPGSATTESSPSAAAITEVASATCNPYGGDKLSFCLEAVSGQCATYAAVHTSVFISPQAADCFKGAYARHTGQPNPCGSNVACTHGFSGSRDGATTPAASAPQPAADKAAPNPQAQPNFVGGGKTSNGDTVRLEGRFGPILPPDESDVDTEVLEECPEGVGGGRELVRRLDVTVFITSGLAGDVSVVQPERSINEEAKTPPSVDFIVAGPEGTSCHKGIDEEDGAVVNFGTLQPQERRTFSVWVVLINALTPADPHPSIKQLQGQEWGMTGPTVLVDGATAIAGGNVIADPTE